MNFRERLRDEMDFKGISGKEIAAKVGISYSTFLSYIDARAVLPNVETAVKIARILDVSVEYLVNGERPENPGREERKLLSIFHELDDETRQSLIKIAEVLTKNSNF